MWMEESRLVNNLSRVLSMGQGARGLEQGAWSKEHGAKSMEQRAWGKEHGARGYTFTLLAPCP